MDQEGTFTCDVEIGLRIRQVTDDRLDLVLREAASLGLAPSQPPHAIARPPQRRRDGEPDVSGGACDEDLHSPRTVAHASRFPRRRPIIHARDPLEPVLDPSRLPLALLEALLGVGEVRADRLERRPERLELLAQAAELVLDLAGLLIHPHPLEALENDQEVSVERVGRYGDDAAAQSETEDALRIARIFRAQRG